MSEILKPCPFCGGEAFYIEIMGNYEKPHEIYCSKCNGAITEGRSEKQVVTNWNTRPIEDELQARIAELKVLVDELKPYRDGYDAYEDFPEEGENVFANLGSWLFLAQRRGDKWYDSLGQQAEIRGGVERWWKLPEVQE